MARDEKRFELKPVEEIREPDEPVVRLETEETLVRPKSGQTAIPAADSLVTKRLALPSRDRVETRTHQPGIEALIEPPTSGVNPLEQRWGEETAVESRLPWGWFVIIAAILAGAVTWSLTRVKKAEVQAFEIRETTKTALSDEATEEREAAARIERIEAAKRAFYRSSTIDELARVVRQPERVRPLMEDYYATRPLVPHAIARTRSLQAVTLDTPGDYWTSVDQLDNGETRSLVLEMAGSGEAKVDWETHVCYQPMDWTEFALQRPAGKSYDFRVYVESDNLFSHEFADASRWNCFRLTATDSIETLFGYARADSTMSAEILAHLKRANGRKLPMILRVTIPEGLQSRRGVVIEKFLSPRWLYLAAPDSGS